MEEREDCQQQAEKGMETRTEGKSQTLVLLLACYEFMEPHPHFYFKLLVKTSNFHNFSRRLLIF